MSDEHSARAGSLNAHLTSVQMEIDDDDEDIILVVVDVVNESSIPIGGLDAALVDAKGARYEPVEGISSIGPGLTRQFKFEASIVSGTWTFEFNGGGQAMKLGPYEADFEFQAEKGRVLGNAIGSSLFSGAFDTHLDAFGNTEERGIIDADSIVMTSYVGENMEGGGTKVIRRLVVANNGMAATKFIMSIRNWLFENFGDEKLIHIVAMATPEVCARVHARQSGRACAHTAEPTAGRSA